MNSPDLPVVLFLSDDQKHKTAEKIDAIQNLLYLIRLDASDPAQVAAYAIQADRILLDMQLNLLPDA
jgi:hypothetical protein